MPRKGRCAGRPGDPFRGRLTRLGETSEEYAQPLHALERLAMAEAMNLTEHGAAIAVRQRNRETHARLAALYDAAIVLAAPGAAPVGLGSTGNPVFNVPASMLGIPAVSLPLLSIEGLPLGLQIAGFVGEDASLFAVAAAVRGGGRDPESAGRSGVGFRNFLRRHRCASGGSPCHCRLRRKRTPIASTSRSSRCVLPNSSGSAMSG